MASLHDKLKLPAPFPSSPTRPPKWHLYFYKDNHLAFSQNFCERYPALILVDLVMKDRTYAWTNDFEIITNDDLSPQITIRSDSKDTLDDIMSHTLTNKESQWYYTQPITSWVANLRGETVSASMNIYTNTDKKRLHKSADSAPKRKRTKSSSRKRRAPLNASDVTLAMICDELNIQPRDARKKLRSSKTPKPEAGWVWPAEEADAIKEILK